MAIMTYEPDTYPWDRTKCASWCSKETSHRHDPACWGEDLYVNLTMEDGFPHGALPGMAYRFDPPRIGVSPYRNRTGWQSVVYLHLYRPSETPHLDIDCNLELTSDEARQLAANLGEVAGVLDGAR